MQWGIILVSTFYASLFVQFYGQSQQTIKRRAEIIIESTGLDQRLAPDGIYSWVTTERFRNMH